MVLGKLLSVRAGKSCEQMKDAKANFGHVLDCSPWAFKIISHLRSSSPIDRYVLMHVNWEYCPYSLYIYKCWISKLSVHDSFLAPISAISPLVLYYFSINCIVLLLHIHELHCTAMICWLEWGKLTTLLSQILHIMLGPLQ